MFHYKVFYVYYQLRPAVRTADFERFAFAFSFRRSFIFYQPIWGWGTWKIIPERPFQENPFLSERGAGPEISRRAARAGGAANTWFHKVLSGISHTAQPHRGVVQNLMLFWWFQESFCVNGLGIMGMVQVL